MNEREQLYHDILETINISFEIMHEYDIQPHMFGGTLLFQAESSMLEHIGDRPKITLTELAKIERKTKGACSKILRKLINKELVTQQRNKDNLREYFLNLTKTGKEAYKCYKEISESHVKRHFDKLDGFSKAELNTYLEIQKKLNESAEKYEDYIAANTPSK